MIFRQFINDDLGCASYLVGDEHAGVAAVVDGEATDTLSGALLRSGRDTETVAVPGANR